VSRELWITRWDQGKAGQEANYQELTIRLRLGIKSVLSAKPDRDREREGNKPRRWTNVAR